MGSRQIVEKSLSMLRSLPRISLANIRDNPNCKKKVCKAIPQFYIVSNVFCHIIHRVSCFSQSEAARSMVVINMALVTKGQVRDRIS